MASHFKNETEFHLAELRGWLKWLRDGDFTLRDFCRNVLSSLADSSANGHEEVWKPCLESLPRDLLRALDDFAESELKPSNYEIEPSFAGEVSKEAYEREKRNMSAAYDRLHVVIKQQVQARDGQPAT